MASMFRRAIRIFCLVGLAVLLVTAVTTQFYSFGLYSPHASLRIYGGGVTIEYSRFPVLRLYKTAPTVSWDHWYGFISRSAKWSGNALSQPS